jgi:cell fate (sporulation/competence/biofilm development) regulator YlbF (YheA/YmcA/DUF963 family)
MDEVAEHARKLADLLAAHPRTKELREATEAIAGDATAKSLEEDYSRISAEVHHLEETGRPIEPEMKRRVIDLQTRIRKSPPLQRLFRAHAQFAEMMDGVQRTLSGALDAALGGGAEAQDGAGPESAEPGAPPSPETPPAKPDEPGPSRILWTP